ncbi:MAG: hypothetical protein A2Y09_05280 [Planctomycetes bacterium GWA2_39_15]|nr:MAG: hypothetical protein A2Y09_05280 [Planctomycetes bacterium GWA2_39_15]
MIFLWEIRYKECLTTVLAKNKPNIFLSTVLNNQEAMHLHNYLKNAVVFVHAQSDRWCPAVSGQTVPLRNITVAVNGTLRCVK